MMGTPIYDELYQKYSGSGRGEAKAPVSTVATPRKPKRPRKVAPVTDTLFADVSEFQNPVNDSYPHPVLSIRSNDGTYRDHKFAQNYGWLRANLDSGRIACGIVYAYCRVNWDATANTLIDMVN